MKRKWIIIILICALSAAVLLVGLSLRKNDSPWKKNTAGEAIGVELSEIDHILVSTEVYYLDNHDSALWTTVTNADKVEEIYQAISSQELKEGYPGDDGIAGGGPRFVIYVLKDGGEIPIRFVDDQQFWRSDGSVYWLKKPFQLYEMIDETLTDYVYLPRTEEDIAQELVNADIIRMFFYNGVRYRASGDIQMDWPEGYTLLGHTDTREENWGEDFSANFMGEIFQKGDSFYAKEDGELTYVKFVPDPRQDVVVYNGNEITFDIQGVSSLEIFSSLSGKDVILTDASTIESILQNINSQTFEISDNQEPAPGGSYNLIFWNSAEQEITSVAVQDLEGKRIIYDTHYYDLSGEGGIDVSYIAELVEGEN